MSLIARLTRAPGPLTVIDTHAGAGLYDLYGDSARRSGEAAQGVVKLMGAKDAPTVFDPLKAAVRAENPQKDVRYYPGSPLVAMGALRPGDRYVGYELRADDQADLERLLLVRTKPGVNASAEFGDGYAAMAEGRAGSGRRLALIDPPFERGDEYAQVVEAIRADSRRGGEAVHAVWTPLKDLQTFDTFLGGLESIGLGGGLAIETRLRPLTEPLRLNGCAVVLLGPPELLAAMEAPARAAADWIAKRLGSDGAEARIERLS